MKNSHIPRIYTERYSFSASTYLLKASWPAGVILQVVRGILPLKPFAEVPGGGTRLFLQIGEIGFIHSGQDAHHRQPEFRMKDRI